MLRRGRGRGPAVSPQPPGRHGPPCGWASRPQAAAAALVPGPGSLEGRPGPVRLGRQPRKSFKSRCNGALAGTGQRFQPENASVLAEEPVFWKSKPWKFVSWVLFLSAPSWRSAREKGATGRERVRRRQRSAGGRSVVVGAVRMGRGR